MCECVCACACVRVSLCVYVSVCKCVCVCVCACVCTVHASMHAYMYACAWFHTCVFAVWSSTIIQHVIMYYITSVIGVQAIVYAVM